MMFFTPASGASLPCTWWACTRLVMETTALSMAGSASSASRVGPGQRLARAIGRIAQLQVDRHARTVDADRLDGVAQGCAAVRIGHGGKELAHQSVIGKCHVGSNRGGGLVIMPA